MKRRNGAINGQTSSPVRENGVEYCINNGASNVMAVQKCPTAVRTATVAHPNGHNVVVAVSSETATNPVHIAYRISYVFLL